MGHHNKINPVMHAYKSLFFCLLFVCNLIQGQSLLNELNNDLSTTPDTVYAYATFKAPRLINGQSVETIGKNGLNIIISHRFGNLNSGKDNFFGIDESHIRIGFEYGVCERFDIGIGRSRDQKLVDGYLKYKLLRQSSGAVNMPFTISVYTSVAVRTDKGLVPTRNYSLTNRLNYVYELLMARKISEQISLQLMPGIIHRNLTANEQSPNIVTYTGIGGRVKLTSRISLNAEYYYNWTKYISDHYINPLSFGFDIETGGHVFQLHFSNSRAMQEKMMIPENTSDWLKGGFGFGFNIIRHFNLKRK
jgi:hypothetical protein